MRRLHPDAHDFEAYAPTGFMGLRKYGHITLPLDLGIAKKVIFKLDGQWEHGIPHFECERASIKAFSL
jgi:hypothetical protein